MIAIVHDFLYTFIASMCWILW